MGRDSLIKKLILTDLNCYFYFEIPLFFVFYCYNLLFYFFVFYMCSVNNQLFLYIQKNNIVSLVMWWPNNTILFNFITYGNSFWNAFRFLIVCLIIQWKLCKSFILFMQQVLEIFFSFISQLYLLLPI